MYSQEERIKAVQLYIESGNCEGEVIRVLGYPSPNTLRSWYKEYLCTGALHAASAPKPRYTEQQKAVAVAYFKDNKTTLTQACRALGYPTRYVLRRWILEINPELLKKDAKHCATSSSSVKYSQEQKLAAVEAMLVDGIPDYKVAAQYRVCKATIYKWRHQLLGKDGIAPMVKKPDAVQTDKTKAELESEIADLQSEIKHLQMERDALEKATEILKKAGGISLIHLENKEKAEVIDALRPIYRLKDLLRLFHISKSSYCYQENSLHSPDKYARHRAKIHEIFHASKHTYGYRRIHKCLENEGITVSEKVVRRIMSEDNLTVYCKKHKKYSSYIGEVSPAVPNIINRDFHAEAPNLKWLTDITEFGLPAGKVYLSPIIDCFDGLPVLWSIGTSPSAELANTMLDGAISILKEGERPIVHSDRGGHYRWHGWIERMNQAGLTRSMSKKGCSPDNSACEGFFGRLKNEMFYGKSWQDVSIEEFISILDEYMYWYCSKRIKLSLGGKSPMEYRRSLGLVVPCANPAAAITV